uniref:Ig-like domain-containing protein n=1 Tax=Vombatus ursinus TaxID=29139 RepID=A0A4X2KYB4_VOMUR
MCFWLGKNMVIFCLTDRNPMDAGVTQIPRLLIKGKGQKGILRCEQDLGDDAMFWYRQDTNHEIRVMFVYNYQKPVINETDSNRFEVESLKTELNLQIKLLQPEDTATYLCASSSTTELQSSLVPVHKPHQTPAEKQQGMSRAMGCWSRRDHRTGL